MAFKAIKVIALFFNECACHQLLSLVKCFNLLLLRHSARDFTNLKEHDMAVWFVSRHPGAIDWMAQQAHWQVDHWVAHLQLDDVQAGDVVVGTLPLGMAANVCAQGARFWFLEVPMQATQRGQELSAALMTEMGCRLTEFEVKRVPAAGG